MIIRCHLTRPMGEREARNFFKLSGCFMASVFTKIINRELPARILYEDDAFISIIPKHHFVNPGHILVIPKIEIDKVFDLPEEIYKKLCALCHKLSRPLEKITNAKRIGIAVEGFSVAHVHVHLCPLFNLAELDPNRNVAWSEHARDAFMDAFVEALKEF